MATSSKGIISARPKSGGVLDAVANSLADNRKVWFLLIGCLYAIAIGMYSRRPFWYDELFTLYISRLPNMVAVWEALKQGADLNPPVFYLVTRASISAFGSSEFALRIPAMAGFFVMCSCLFLFVSRRAGPSYGFAALILPLLTGSFYYAGEARAYGAMLGFSGLALVAWQNVKDGNRRRLSVAMLGTFLTAALLTHCYAILMLVPFGLGELVRDYRRRQIDWAVWCALIVPLSAIFTYLPLFAATKPFAVDNPIFRPGFHSLTEFYSFLMWPAFWALFVCAAVVAYSNVRRKERRQFDILSAEEFAVAGGFLLVPILAVLVAATVTRMFMLRYGLGAVIGVAILLPIVAAALTGRCHRTGAVIVFILTGWFAARTAIVQWPYLRSEKRTERAVPLERLRPDLPLVISSGLRFLEMDHYASPGLAARMCYLTDEVSARRITGSDVFDKGFPMLRRWFPIRARLEDYRGFLATHRSFLVYGSRSFPLDWLIPKMKEEGVKLTILREDGSSVLLEARMP